MNNAVLVLGGKKVGKTSLINSKYKVSLFTLPIYYYILYKLDLISKIDDENYGNGNNIEVVEGLSMAVYSYQIHTKYYKTEVYIYSHSYVFMYIYIYISVCGVGKAILLLLLHVQ